MIPPACFFSGSRRCLLLLLLLGTRMEEQRAPRRQRRRRRRRPTERAMDGDHACSHLSFSSFFFHFFPRPPRERNRRAKIIRARVQRSLVVGTKSASELWEVVQSVAVFSLRGAFKPQQRSPSALWEQPWPSERTVSVHFSMPKSCDLELDIPCLTNLVFSQPLFHLGTCVLNHLPPVRIRASCFAIALAIASHTAPPVGPSSSSSLLPPRPSCHDRWSETILSPPSDNSGVRKKSLSFSPDFFRKRFFERWKRA